MTYQKTKLVILISLLMAAHAASSAWGGEPAAEQQDGGPRWVLPYEAALKQAKAENKPMLIFIGNLAKCQASRNFINKVGEDPRFVSFASAKLVSTQILENAKVDKDQNWKSKQAMDSLNFHNAYAVIIADSHGKRIGELSIIPESIEAFIKDIQTIIEKAPANGVGRLKYSEVGMIDKDFAPSKTYQSPPPEFVDEPLKGRYFQLLTAVRVHAWENTRARTHGTFMERERHTPAIALKMRESLASAYPEARMTWGWSLLALKDMEPNYVELRKLMRVFHEKYGDEMTFWPGVYFADKYNTLGQAKKDLHEGLQLVTEMMGNGYRPKSVLAGHMSVEDMKYLADFEGIHVVQGQIWSQFNIDGQDGDGGIIYPYYPSKDHFLKPAQGPRGGDDFVDMVNIDGWTVDFFAARKAGGGPGWRSRIGLGPIETVQSYGPKLGVEAMMQIANSHFNDEAVKHNGFGFLTSNWELSLFQWIDPQYLPNFVKALRAKYPDVQMLTLGELGERWRKHNPDNSRINLKFVQRGLNMPSLEEGRKIHRGYMYLSEVFKSDYEIRWYFNKDFRFATIQNWKDKGPKLVMDYTRYNQPYKEPSGNVIERHWDLLDMINQKESRPQDKYKPFTELPPEEQAKILKWYPELK